MYTVKLSETPYYVKNGVIYVSEMHIPFHTTYNVVSPKTGVVKTFTFTRSTGPEFDINTEWIYESSDGLQFIVCNDVDKTAQAAAAYLKGKLRI